MENINNGKCVRCHLRHQSKEGYGNRGYLCEYCQIHGGPGRPGKYTLDQQIAWCKGDMDNAGEL